jgi:hypothetical protein
MTREAAMPTMAPLVKKPPPDAGGANRLLQRKCDCGAAATTGGTCARCVDNETSLRRKLTVGSSNDPLEHEADRVADRVLAGPAQVNFGAGSYGDTIPISSIELGIVSPH